MDDTEECTIARGLRAGDADAWRRLYDAYAARVWRTVAPLLGPGAADVADVVQETFLAAARDARNYDPARGPLWPWLWGVARTQARNALRRRARTDGRAADPPSGHRAEPLDDLLAAEDADLVRGVLLELPAEYGRLLTAKYCLDEPMAEIAARERLSLEAARSKLARARGAFRAAYAKTDRTPEGFKKAST